MPTMTDFYPKKESKYLRVDDITKDTVVTIKNVDAVTFKNQDGTEQTKPVLYFDGLEKALVANKTTFEALSNMIDEDTDAWTDAQIVLYPGKVDFKGRAVPTIRVKRAPKAAKPEFNDSVSNI